MASLSIYDDPNQRDEFNRTLLHVNIHENHLSAVKQLLQRGADISLTSTKGNTPLHTAVSHRYPHMVLALLKYANHDKLKKCIDAQNSQTGNTALHVASSNGCIRSVRHLLSHGANFEVKNNAGERPIDVASDADVIRILETVETYSNLADSGDFKMLQTREFSFEDSVAALHARNGLGWTSLQLAVRQNHAKTVVTICDARVGPRPWSFASGYDAAMLEEMKLHGKEVAKRQMVLVMHADHIRVAGPEAMVEEIVEILVAAYRVVEIAKKVVEGRPNSLAIVEETLEALEFDPNNVGRDAKGNPKFIGKKAKLPIYYRMLRVPPTDVDEYYDEYFFDELSIASYTCILAVAIARSVAMFMRTICTGKDEKEFDDAYHKIYESNQLQQALENLKS